MLIIETFARGCEPRYRRATTPLAIRINIVMIELALSTVTQPSVLAILAVLAADR
jgi:hypothetical protein